MASFAWTYFYCLHTGDIFLLVNHKSESVLFCCSMSEDGITNYNNTIAAEDSITLETLHLLKERKFFRYFIIFYYLGK